MTPVALLSTCAMVMGLGGIVPQLVRMVRTRSAGGQAQVGWALGTAAHASMAYVNLVGFHSLVLGAYSADKVTYNFYDSTSGNIVIEPDPDGMPAIPA